MISKILLDGNLFKVLNASGLLLSNLPSQDRIVIATGASIYVVVNQEQEIIEVYDSSSTLTGSMLKANKQVLGIIENQLIVKNGIFIETYDMMCNKLLINNAVSAFTRLKDQSIEALKQSLELHLAIIQSLKVDMVKKQHYNHSADLSKITSKLDELISLCTR